MGKRDLEECQIFRNVIIVGGGPAGACLAYRLAREGLDVLLLERSSLPRSKPCAGGITRRAVQELPFDPEPVIEEKISSFIFGCRPCDPVEIVTAEPEVYTVRRENFDAFLLHRAASAGAGIITGIRVQKVETGGAGCRVIAGGKTFRCKILAGADGANSIVARALGLSCRKACGVTLDCHLPLPAGIPEGLRGTIRIDYGFLQGYAWVFPKKGSLSIGAGSMQGPAEGVRPALEKMIASLQLKVAAEPIAKRGWILPLNPFPRRLHSSAALLLGDAAGLVDSFSGEGIFYALKSARLAAGVIVDTFMDPCPDLRGYSALIKAEMGPELAIAWRLSRLFYRNAPLYHRLLLRRPELAGEYLRLPSGTGSYSGFFRLCLKKLLQEGLSMLQPT